MRETRQKKITKRFFNKVAGEWHERTYDPSATYAVFPSNKVRMETALSEIRRLGLKGKVLDIGCGTGELAIELVKMGLRVTGIDIAKNMIERAKANLRRSGLEADPEKTFIAGDLAKFSRSPKEVFRGATALGLLEYLDSDEELFSCLKKTMAKGGYALVECRNKFFNLFSLNQYTVDLAESGELPDLVNEFIQSSHYGRLPELGIPEIQKDVSSAMAAFLKTAGKKKEWYNTKVPAFTKYPLTMKRRQHTPRMLEQAARNHGFRLEYVVWWHAHPYPPSWEKHFPRIYNRLAALMGPLGHTPLGAWFCSSFLAVLRKIR